METNCTNIWKLEGGCKGEVRHYRISDSQDGVQTIYDDETKAPFEKSGFSIKGAYEVTSGSSRALITALCDDHLQALIRVHPDWQIRQTRDPLAD